MDAKCSFSELQKSSFIDFRGSAFAVRRFLECKDDITGRLQSCHLSKLVGDVEEHDLHVILMSAGKFDLPTHQQECMWIYPKTLKYPLHSSTRKKTEEQRCGESADVKKYANYFGVTIIME